MGFLKRKKQLPRQLALGKLEDAMGQVQQEPARIHNPNGGTRSHYQGSSGGPECKASGTAWAEGDGGLQLCGLCPYMWGQRQERERQAKAS